MAVIERLHALLDASGNVVTADPLLIELNQRAGGDAKRLNLAGLGPLARQVSKLGVPLARLQTLSIDDKVARFWARLTPVADGVELVFTPYDGDPPHEQPARFDPMREVDFERSGVDFIWEVDAALHFVALSEAALGIFQRHPEELVGQPITRLFAFAEVDGDVPIVRAVIGGGRLDYQLAELLVPPAGRRFILTGEVVRDADGRASGLRGTAVAAGEAGPEEQALPAATAATVAEPDPPRAPSIAAALARPISQIVETAEAFEEQRYGPLRDVYAGYASDIAEAGRMLRALVNDMAEAETIESGALRLDLQRVELDATAARARSLLAFPAERRQIELQLAGSGFGIARADPRYVLQILVNLVGNAAKFAPEGGTVRVLPVAPAGFVGVAVEDDGPGLSPEHRERVFDKFERLGAGGEGAGLGLYIARSLARAMGGDLIAEAATGGGARFVLTLPPA